MEPQPYDRTNEIVLRGTEPPGALYWVVLLVLSGGIATALALWIYQVRYGMGVAGISHPVGWGVYIANFVFWVGIAHSGTLISAILFLVRARWRNAVSRSAEAMTVFAVMTAGLFPLIHLGRLWVVYYILPYPSQRQIWPNFQSPLVWDVVAVTTYFTVSAIFFYVGLIPDLAAARDRSEASLGADHPKTRLYRAFALGWCGALSQWRHYGRSYLYFAALATPLVISVHSIVSWDFAVSLLPGWHTTIFAPYFVAGAIHSGLAMVLTLVIPMRHLLGLKDLITQEHLEAVAKTIVVTAAIVAYSYVIEEFIAWYSGKMFEEQFAHWRMFGERGWMYWVLMPLNVFFPLLFCLKRVRANVMLLFAISIGINVGMWLERFVIVSFSMAHDFLPHNWGSYTPTLVEVGITLGSFAWFLFWYLLFAKTLPTVAMADMKEELAHREAPPPREPEDEEIAVATPVPEDAPALLALFSDAGKAENGLREALREGYRQVELFAPVRLEGALASAGYLKSPIRFWTLFGALSGVTVGFGLPVGAALVNALIVGGKHPVALIPYCILGFELMVLFGCLANFLSLLVSGRLFGTGTMRGYDQRFSRDRFGLLVAGEDAEALVRLMAKAGASETRYLAGGER